MSWLPSPTEQALAERQALEAEVATHLAQLPGVLRASVVIAAEPAPLPRLDAPAPASPPSVSAVLVLRPGAAPPAPPAELRALVAAAVPGSRADDVRLVVSAEPGPATTLAHLGPFEVAPGSVPTLTATLAGALVVIALLGILLFRSERARAR